MDEDSVSPPILGSADAVPLGGGSSRPSPAGLTPRPIPLSPLDRPGHPCDAPRGSTRRTP